MQNDIRDQGKFVSFELFLLTVSKIARNIQCKSLCTPEAYSLLSH